MNKALKTQIESTMARIQKWIDDSSHIMVQGTDGTKDYIPVFQHPKAPLALGVKVMLAPIGHPQGRTTIAFRVRCYKSDNKVKEDNTDDKNVVALGSKVTDVGEAAGKTFSFDWDKADSVRASVVIKAHFSIDGFSLGQTPAALQKKIESFLVNGVGKVGKLETEKLNEFIDMVCDATNLIHTAVLEDNKESCGGEIKLV